MVVFQKTAMRGYLKSPGHTYKLDDDVITVGKGSGKEGGKAHIPLPDVHAEKFHARIEKHEEKGCYVLVDLNTAYGTYINEHRIQNSSVKLAPGDVIRFGRSGVPHELEVNFLGKNQSSRTSSGRGRTPSPLIPQPPLSEVRKSLKGQLNVSEEGASHSSSGLGTDITFRPDTAPQSQRDSLHTLGERANSVPLNMKIKGGGRQPTMDHIPQLVTTTPTPVETKMSHMRENSALSVNIEPADENEFTVPSEPWYVEMLREKEKRILHMGDEISRLAMYEAESNRKDLLLHELREKIRLAEQEIHELHANKFQEQEEKLQNMGDEINRLVAYENECERKEKVIAALRDDIVKLEIENQMLCRERLQSAAERQHDEDEESLTDTEKLNIQNHKKSSFTSDKSVSFETKIEILNNDLNLVNRNADKLTEKFNEIMPEKLTPEIEVLKMQEEIEEKNKIISNLTVDLNQVRKDHSMSLGVINSIQRLVQQKDNELFKLNMMDEKNKKALQESQEQIQMMSGKFSNMREEKKQIQMLAAVENELQMVKEQLHIAELKVTKQQEKMEKQSREIRKCHKQVRQYAESEKKLFSDVDTLNRELENLKRSKQICQVSLEQTSAHYERLRSVTIQAVFTAPGAIRPETLVTDEEVYNALAQVIRDRSEFHKQLTETGQEVTPLLILLDPPEEDKLKDEQQNKLTPTPDKKGKGGRKSPKSK